MKRDVVLTAKAEQQLHEAAGWYAEKNPHVSDDWFNGILAAIENLANDAERFALARRHHL